MTDNGESFYQHASLILEELRAAQDELLQRQGEQAGQINIGLGASVARSLMPSVICRFHQQHPQVKVRIMEGQLLAMINELRQGELDFTINTYYPGPYDHEFSFEKLFEKPSPGKVTLSPRSVTLISCSSRSPPPRWWFWRHRICLTLRRRKALLRRC